ncbi:hypothetical protein PFISCL1PPCAC_1225, partial [Pristionchus fissidentatus]
FHFGPGNQSQRQEMDAEEKIGMIAKGSRKREHRRGKFWCDENPPEYEGKGFDYLPVLALEKMIS